MSFKSKEGRVEDNLDKVYYLRVNKFDNEIKIFKNKDLGEKGDYAKYYQ